MSREQIGTVRITRPRVYQLDPYASPHRATTVVVSPGTYPVYRDHGLSHYWQMTGVLNHNHLRLGDGMFTMQPADVPSDDEVTFYSQRYGPDEWGDLLGDFAADPDPALVFDLDGEATL